MCAVLLDSPLRRLHAVRAAKAWAVARRSILGVSRSERRANSATPNFNASSRAEASAWSGRVRPRHVPLTVGFHVLSRPRSHDGRRRGSRSRPSKCRRRGTRRPTIKSRPQTDRASGSSRTPNPISYNRRSLASSRCRSQMSRNQIIASFCWKTRMMTRRP